MTDFFNWLFAIAYFSVFFIGLLACFQIAKNYWVERTIGGNTVFAKRALTLKSIAAASIALCAIGGLLQAVAGV